jgi:hypothetical protein
MTIKGKLFKNLRDLLDMGAEFSGITVSDEAIKKALDGNGAMCEALLFIINERFEWWIKCDINKAIYAKEIYDRLENFYDNEEWDNE